MLEKIIALEYCIEIHLLTLEMKRYAKRFDKITKKLRKNA